MCLEQEIGLIISTTTTQFLGKLLFLFSSVFTLMPCVDDSECSGYKNVEKYDFLSFILHISIEFSFNSNKKGFIFYGKYNSGNTDIYLFRWSI